MSFGDNFQQLSSHRALLHLQDAEIQLLESMKKCIDQRIKSDRQYASALTLVVSHAQKLDSGISNPLFQVISVKFISHIICCCSTLCELRKTILTGCR